MFNLESLLCFPKYGSTMSSIILLYCNWSIHLQHYSFYDFIINKARGKSGPLFSFDVHDDVRLVGDATMEKDEVCRRVFIPVSHHLMQ